LTKRANKAGMDVKEYIKKRREERKKKKLKLNN
jgi:hypothetical protein